jgi:hypothetical protein
VLLPTPRLYYLYDPFNPRPRQRSDNQKLPTNTTKTLEKLPSRWLCSPVSHRKLDKLDLLVDNGVHRIELVVSDRSFRQRDVRRREGCRRQECSDRQHDGGWVYFLVLPIPKGGKDEVFEKLIRPSCISFIPFAC